MRKYSSTSLRSASTVGSAGRSVTVAGARAARRQPRHLDRDQSEVGAHRQAVALAGEEMLFVQIGAERCEAAGLAFAGKRHDRLGSKRLQPRQRRVRALAERLSDVLGEADDETVSLAGIESEAVRDRRRHQDRAGRRERNNRGLVGHLAAAARDQQNLEEVAVAVRADRPVMHRRARGDRFDVDEVERLIVRRIAVEMKQRQRGHRHAGSLGPAGGHQKPRRPLPSG